MREGPGQVLDLWPGPPPEVGPGYILPVPACRTVTDAGHLGHAAHECRFAASPEIRWVWRNRCYRRSGPWYCPYRKDVNHFLEAAPALLAHTLEGRGSLVGEGLMKAEEMRYFLTHELGMTLPAVERLMGEADEQGWTEQVAAGPFSVCLARLPNTAGMRTQNYQVTVK